MSTVSVNYTTSGLKELKLRLSTPNGQVLESHSTIYVIDPGGDMETSSSSTFRDGKIRKPFIVVEGFDLWILSYLTADELPDDEVNLGYTNHAQFAHVFYNSSTFYSDYDLVFIDWNNST